MKIKLYTYGNKFSYACNFHCIRMKISKGLFALFEAETVQFSFQFHTWSEHNADA
jgi:hypothetical protein